MPQLGAGGHSPVPLPLIPKVFIPVLHIITPPGSRGGDALKTHVVAQAHVAVSNGADGLALWSAEAGLPISATLDAAAAVAAEFPTLPLIINFMCPVGEALESVPPFAHLWTDKGVDVRGVHTDVIAALGRRRADWQCTWLAGYFFKGSQRDFMTLSDDTLAASAKAVAEFSDVPITSGAGTGVPPVPAELARLRKALFSASSVTRLANASGVNIDNVSELLPGVDVFLIATGIERDASDSRVLAFYRECGLPAVDVGYLDAAKTRSLADAIHAYEPAQMGV